MGQTVRPGNADYPVDLNFDPPNLGQLPDYSPNPLWVPERNVGGGVYDEGRVA